MPRNIENPASRVSLCSCEGQTQLSLSLPITAVHGVVTDVLTHTHTHTHTHTRVSAEHGEVLAVDVVLLQLHTHTHTHSCLS